MKFSRQLKEVTISNTANVTSPTSMAFVSNDGIFAVHRDFGIDEDYVLTHLSTGIKFPYYFCSHVDAKRYAKEVATIFDWSQLRFKVKEGTRKVEILPNEAHEIIKTKCNEIYKKYRAMA